MKTLLSFLWLLLGVALPVSSFGQSSYLQTFPNDNNGLPVPLLWDVVNDEAGSLSLLMGLNPLFPGSHFQIIRLNSNGNPADSYNIHADQGLWLTPWDYKQSGSYQTIVYRSNQTDNPAFNKTCLFVLNFEEGIYWAKQITSHGILRGCAAISPFNRVIVSQHIIPNLPFHPSGLKLGFSVLELQTGLPVWDRYYRTADGPGTPERYTPVDVDVLPSGDYAVVGTYGGVTVGTHFLLKLSADGVPQNSIAFQDSVFTPVRIFTQSLDADGNIYLAGQIRVDTSDYLTSLGVIPDYYEGFVAKLDADYNVLWSKRLTAERFPCLNLNIKAFPDGQVVFTYVTYGNLPVVSGKISSDGSLLWHRGYEFFDPDIALGADTSIYFLSNRKYFQDGSWEQAGVLAKTDPQGNIADCPQFNACVSLVDMPLTIKAWQWTSEPAPPLTNIDVQVLPFDFATTPYCGTPAPPSAEFSLPDTVCQFTCLAPDSLQNRLAHFRQWRLTGPGVDTLFADSTFSWCYNVPGRYTVEQEVWLLGCSEFYSRSIEVLPDNLLPPLGEDRSLCDTPYELKPLSNRPLRSFLWSDGSTGSSLNVSDSGTYSLVATDGYCSVSDTVALRFVRKELSEPPLDLGAETALCPVLLPYVLRPQRPYSEVFFIDNSTTSAQEFALSQAGNYTISTWIEDCLFSETLQLKVEPCPVPIYLPNSFSPNDDGINDRIVPQGEDYRGIRLEVYDRWGGLRHQSIGVPFDWDGKSDGKPLGTGVYVVVFYYQNLRSLQEEHIAQDVLLIR